MENKFCVGEFVVYKGAYGTLYEVVCITGEKLENGKWPAIAWDSKVGLHIPEQHLFKINWETHAVADLSLSKNEKYEAVRDELIHIRDKLDELDQDDYFGTQGWKYQFGMED